MLLQLQSLSLAPSSPYLLITSILFGVTLFLYRIFLSPISRLPGPISTSLSSIPFYYHDYIGQRNKWILTLHTKYGPIVRLSPHEVSISSASAIRDVYTGSQLKSDGRTVSGGTYNKGKIFEIFRHFGARNAVSAKDAEDHGWRRKIIAKDFSLTSVVAREARGGDVWKSVGKYLNLLRREGEVQNSEKGEIVRADFHSANMYFSGDTIAAFVFGSGSLNALDGDQESRDVVEATVEKESAVVPMVMLEFMMFLKRLDAARMAVLRLVGMEKKEFIPSEMYVGGHFRIWAWKRYLQVKQLLEDGELDEGNVPTSARFAANAIAGERFKGIEDPVGEDTGLLVYRSSTGEEIGRFLRDKGAASESCDEFLAGIDTASDQASYTIYVLALRPEWQDKIRQELARLQVPLGFSAPLSHDSLVALMVAPVLDAVVKESLRAFSAAGTSFHRVVPPGGRVIDDYFVPEGTTIAATPLEVNRDQSVFGVGGQCDVSQWLPERWLDGNSTAMEKRLWSFGSGGRGCVGKHFGLLELKLLVAGILLRYKIAPLQRESSSVQVRNKQWIQRKTVRETLYFPDASGVIEFTPTR